MKLRNLSDVTPKAHLVGFSCMLGHAHVLDHHVVDVCLHISTKLVGKNFVDHSLVSSSDIFNLKGITLLQ